jgi:hypothetical protein
MKTPVAFIIFNRPDTTKRVFEAIRQAKPPKLLVIADGPRADRPGEAEKCTATRAIIGSVDWECEVLTNYSDVNLGCKIRVSSGLDWVFSEVEEAIILEDDCLPEQSFFQFCELMLDHYSKDTRIMLITGSNPLRDWKSNIQSYHFSYYGGIWGWATWKRAWDFFDVNMLQWGDAEIKYRVRDVLADEKQYKARKKIYETTYKGMIDTWDFQWSFIRLVQSGLSIVSSVNLISNIGFNSDATHTKLSDSHLSNIPREQIQFPLKINTFVAVDRDYDKQLFLFLTKKFNILKKVRQKVNEIVMNIFKTSGFF